jgi:hypothetical protein
MTSHYQYPQLSRIITTTTTRLWNTPSSSTTDTTTTANAGEDHDTVTNNKRKSPSSSQSTTTSTVETKNTSVTNTNTATTNNEENDDTARYDDNKYDMPWSKVQEWALTDHLDKYTIQVLMGQNNGDSQQQQQLRMYTLWRTLTNEVPTLAGYPLSFLVEQARNVRRHHHHHDENANMTLSVSGSTTTQTIHEILPYIDGYSFTAEGGVTGRVYGMAGVADGTRLETTPVSNLPLTLPKGYLLTQEGMLYELGYPASETTALDRAASAVGSTTSMAQRLSTKSAPDEEKNQLSVGVADVMADTELIKLGALTAVVLGGAWAMESLSHHLTVNVFWV